MVFRADFAAARCGPPSGHRPLGFLSKAGLALPGPVYDSAAGWHWSSPQPGMFGIDGGLALTPEFLALVGALGLYAAAYCAEIVRAGLQAMPRGQWNAASALGMRRGQQLRLVVLPQALRVIIPPIPTWRSAPSRTPRWPWPSATPTW
ncbi:ABC transporter permease subunit [Delftia tsuruhatensis]